MESSTGPQKADATAGCPRGFWVKSAGEAGAFQGTSMEVVTRRRGCNTDIDRNMNPIPTSLAGSECTLRRIVRSSGCGLCGDCKLISPQRRKLVKQVQRTSAPCPEQHKPTHAIKEDLHPTVNLCDVVLNSDARCLDCGFVLPHGLETKTVHCFKQDMSAAGLQLRSRCSGHLKRGKDKHQNGMSRGRLQSDEVCQPCSLHENRKQLAEDEDRETLINHTDHPFVKGWPNAFATSTLTENPTGEQIIQSDPRRACDAAGTELYGGKANNADFSETHQTLRVTPDLKTIQPNGLSNEENRCRTSNSHSRPHAELPVTTCNEVRDGPETCTTPEETPELLDDDHESFTCQRVRVHVWKRNDSCARTYITWHNKRLSVNGFMIPEISTNYFAQTEVIPSGAPTPREPSPSFSRSDDVNDRVDGRRLEETDEDANAVQCKSEQLEPEQTMNTDRPPDAAEPSSSPASFDHDGEALNSEAQPPSDSQPGPPGSSSSKLADDESRPAENGASGDTPLCVLDEFTAYQQDILLVDVNHDDSELFGDIPQESLLKLGPDRVNEGPKTLITYGVSQTSKQSWTPVNINLLCESPDNEESSSRPWRPQKSSTHSKSQRILFRDENCTKSLGKCYDGRDIQERDVRIEEGNESHNPITPLWKVRNGPRTTDPANKPAPKCLKMNSYCRMFFSESQSCNYKICRFLHVAMEGDEKFCINTVARFTKNPMCLQKAGALFTSYYQDNPPGMFFSMPVFVSLIWALLKAGILPDVLSVLSVGLAHKIAPTHEFLLALFTIVREKGFTSVVPPLLQLTYKMAGENLTLSLDCFDAVKNTPEFQKMIHSNVSAPQRSSASTGVPVSDSLNLAHAIVEMELCAKQEDWRCLGKAFRSICTPCQHPSQLERISGHIAVALLSETKDKLSVPFAAFAETICPNEEPNSLLIGFIGRIGVSLMQRYHKTQQWAKGRKVVEVLTQFKITYSMQKGLFGNEDGGSRCRLITLAAELFLLSGSLEGALKTLRESKWFVSSSTWPCKNPDLESRSRVLAHLAEKASQRDALEVLCNLPGIQEPNDQVDISKYTPLFNAHLQVCVDRLMLPVASDSADLMLSRKVPVDGAVLRALLHNLGKQNHWLRAREVFRHSLTAGYYPAVSAPAGFMALIVPSRLGEVELALTFEMLITVNASLILPISQTTPSTLDITLKRGQESESEYLSAGSRLLSAALVPQPKLEVHYSAVNSSQEQVFTLSVASARRWLRSNHMWANEVWII